ncbi:MAG TPA: DUF3750 domain-containing protein [Hyphomicrobiales bacterium]|nr:DUF3750 domain-containing protein [Hyphomicrobiales bacterium]
MRPLFVIPCTLLLLLLGPLYMMAFGSEAAGIDTSRSWQFASRDSTGLAPDPRAHPEAIIQVYAARTWSWRGNLAVHTWISTKGVGEDHYLVHQVIGFRARRGLPVVSSEEDAPDRLWYGNPPQLLLDLRGEKAAELLPAVLDAVRSYPYPDSYTMWPGPNSNTFVAHVGRQVPELRLTLPVTAIGKDYLPGGALLAQTPSGTGYQMSLFGLAGVMAALDEGIEINLLGLAAGIDFRRPALKLPGIGRLGLRAEPAAQ